MADHTATSNAGDWQTSTPRSADDRHRALADRQRRSALAVLADGEPRGLEELAAAVAGQDGTGATPRRLVVSLHHQHLPLLDTLGVLSYDSERRRITDCDGIDAFLRDEGDGQVAGQG
jgi:predicted transcriptional regulator